MRALASRGGSVVLVLWVAALVGGGGVAAAAGLPEKAIVDELTSRHRTPARLPASLVDWPEWSTASVVCSPPGLVAQASQYVEECGVETVAYLDQVVQVIFPEGSKTHGREGLEAISASLDVPFSVLKCYARARAVNDLRAQGVSELEIESWKKRINAAVDVVNLGSNMAGLSETLLEEGTKAAAVSGDLVGIGVAEGNAEGFVGTMVDAWRSFHANRLAGFDSDFDAAEAQLDRCRVDAAEAAIERVVIETRQYLAAKRWEVAAYEKQIFCEVRASDPGGTAREAVGAAKHAFLLDWANKQQEEAAGKVVEIGDRAEAVAREVESAREELEDLKRRLADAEVRVGPAIEACDLVELAFVDQELAHLAGLKCAEPGGWLPTIDRSRQYIEEAVDSFQQAQSDLDYYAGAVRTFIESCDVDAAHQALQKLQSDIATATSTSKIPLANCPSLAPWPPDQGLADEIAARKQALEAAKVRARGLLQETRAAGRECRFETAWSLIEEAAAAIEESGCPVDDSYCGGRSIPVPALCELANLEQERLDVEREMGTLESEYHDASSVIVGIAEELLAYAQEELDKARAEDATRCIAATQTREACRDLQGLQDPKGCEDTRVQAFRDQGTRVEQELAAHEAALDSRQESLLSSAQAAADGCDADGLAEALGELERLQPLLCGRAAPDTSALRQKLEVIGQLAGEVARSIQDVERDLAAWLDGCDPGPLSAAGERLSGLPECALDGLDPETRARVATLVGWEAQAPRLPALADRVARELGLYLQRAETHIGAAERRLDAGLADAVSRQAFDLERQQARNNLDEARSTIEELGVDPAMSEACLADPGARLAGLERRWGELAAPDVGAEPEEQTDEDPVEPIEPETPPLPGEGSPDGGTAGWGEGTSQDLTAGETGSADEGGAAQGWGTGASRDLAPGGQGTGVSPDTSALVSSVQQAVAGCSYQQALGLLDQILAIDPGHAWARSERPKVETWIAKDRRCQQSIQSAQGFLAGGQIADAFLQLASAKKDASPCNGGLIDDLWERVKAEKERQEQIAAAQQEAMERERERQEQERNRQAMGELADALGDLLRTWTAAQGGGTTGGGGATTGGGGGSTSQGGGQGGGGIRCVTENLSFAHVAEGAPLAYLVYRLDPTDTRSIDRGYGIMTVPTRLMQGKKVLCNSARSCVRKIWDVPYQILSEHGTKAAADQALHALCPNPVHSGGWGR